MYVCVNIYIHILIMYDLARVQPACGDARRDKTQLRYCCMYSGCMSYGLFHLYYLVHIIVVCIMVCALFVYVV